MTIKGVILVITKPSAFWWWPKKVRKSPVSHEIVVVNVVLLEPIKKIIPFLLWFFSRKTKKQRLQKKYRKDTMMSNHFCEKWLIFSRENASSRGNYLVLWLAVNRTWIKRGCEQVISFILRRITTLLCQIKHDQEEKGSSSWFLLEGLKNGKKILSSFWSCINFREKPQQI